MEITAAQFTKSDRKIGEFDREIIELLKHDPGLSDRELTEKIVGYGLSLTNLNQNCRTLEARGLILRKKRDDGLIGNWLIESNLTQEIFAQIELQNKDEDISEKKIKNFLHNYLIGTGWEPEISRSAGRGIDIEAKRGTDRWIIQVKGTSTFSSLVVNSYLSLLGEIFQRIDDPNCKYSIALPDTEQFRRFWGRSPDLAKKRLGITALFVSSDGDVTELFS